MRILVLTLERPFYEEVNNFLIPRSLLELGHEVTLGNVDTLCLLGGEVQAKMGTFEGGAPGAKHVPMDRYGCCADFDAIWLLEYCHPRREREFFQLMWILEQSVSFINKPSSMFFLNNKIGVMGLEASRYFADSNVVMTEEQVKDIMVEEPSSTWVLKPPNMGCGAGVFLLRQEDPNLSSLIQSATGNAYQKYEMHTKEAFGQAEDYTIVQKFIPEMSATENRVLVAGGVIVGGYKKTPVGTEFRGNFMLGGKETRLAISEDARRMCEESGRELQKFGIHFVGIDLAYPYIVEYNMVNPGGISGHLAATGEDIGPQACRAALNAALGI